MYYETFKLLVYKPFIKYCLGDLVENVADDLSVKVMLNTL